jgi:SAM-dependent methyltransferase
MVPTYYSSQRGELHEFLPASLDSLLDIGCAEGGYGSAVLTKHPPATVWGVEPHKPAADLAAKRLSRVINDVFRPELPIPDAHFDVITFNDSIEHMADEYAALRLARRKLKPGGTLICCVPNVRYLENVRQLLLEADWRYTDNGVLDRTHLRFFTQKSICRAITETGFTISTISGINSHWWSGWKVALLRLAFQSRIDDMRWQQFVIVAQRPASDAFERFGAGLSAQMGQ